MDKNINVFSTETQGTRRDTEHISVKLCALCVSVLRKLFKQMKKNRFYIGLVLAALLITACNKDEEDPTIEIWKQQNEQAFNDLARDPDFTKLWIEGDNESYIYYRVIQKGEGKPLFYNGWVEVYYKGWFVATNADKNIKAGDVFDQRLFDDGATIIFPVVSDNLSRGWSVALQHMVEGDKWEIRIPYQLGYGSEDRSGIPAYSTLAFEIEIIMAIDPYQY